MTAFLFYLLAAILLCAAFYVVVARQIVHATLSLILCFFTAAALWMLMRAEFLAIALVLIYVGAVMVLFLFVVMMLDLNLEESRQGFWRRTPLAIAVALVMALELVLVLVQRGESAHGGEEGLNTAMQAGAEASNIAELGRALYTAYLLPVELAAAILLAAMIAAIGLTLRHRKASRYQNPAEQVRVQKSERLRIITMPPSPPPAAADTPPPPAAIPGSPR